MNKNYFNELNNRISHAYVRLCSINEEIFGPAPSMGGETAQAVESAPSINTLAARAMEAIDQVQTQISALEDMIKGK